MISRFPAIAPRVANPIAVAIAMIINTNRAAANNDDDVRHGVETREPQCVIVEAGLGDSLGQRRAQRLQIRLLSGLHVHHDKSRDRQLR